MTNDPIMVYSDYGNEFEITREQAGSCAHPGQCYEDVKALIPELDLSRIDPDNLRLELSQYGVWTESDLADHEDNLERWVWLCASDIMDGVYDPQ